MTVRCETTPGVLIVKRLSISGRDSRDLRERRDQSDVSYVLSRTFCLSHSQSRSLTLPP